MKKALFSPLFLSLLLSCSQQETANDTPSSLFPSPKEVVLNVSGGYTTNVITGDTIQPHINSLGDTVKTGVPIAIQGKMAQPDSTYKPEKVPVSKTPTAFKAHTNQYKVSNNIPTIIVDETKLKIIKLGEGQQNFVLVSTQGDTIPTGVPIPAKGNLKKAINPTSHKALPPSFRDVSTVNIQYLDLNQGMITSYVKTILEDKNGNLWFGTNKGASKYDGVSFTHYTKREGLANFVHKIIEDSNGNLWFATDNGAIRYDGNTFLQFTEKDGLPSNNVINILEDKKGNLWFSTFGEGMSKFSKNENGSYFFTNYTKKEGLSNNYINCILEDTKGNLWIGTESGGICMFNGESFVHYTKENGLSKNTVRSIIEDDKGNLWFGTYGGGANYFDGKSFKHFTKNEGLSSNIILSMLKDKKGNIWFGTLDGGVTKLNGDSFEYLTEKEGLSKNWVWAIMENKNGKMWFGTYNGGANCYNENSFTTYTKNELSTERIISAIEAKSGLLWFGTFGGGVLRYDGESFTCFKEQEGLSNNIIFSILEDTKENLWFSTFDYSRVNKYDGNSFTYLTEKNGLLNDITRSNYEDSNKNIWLGTWEGGVCKITPIYNANGSVSYAYMHITEQEGLSHNSVWSILEDKKGNIWFGTSYGVCCFDGKFLTILSEKEGLTNNYVNSIVEDKKGNLWLGTKGGLCCFNGKVFTHFTEKEGLSNNVVKSLSLDKKGNLWIFTENGLNNLILDGSNRIIQFLKNDGLKSLDFNENTSLLDSKNKMWMGSDKGLNMLDLNEFKLSDKTPKPFLKQLDINEQFIDYRNMSDSLADEISYTDVQEFQNYPLNLKIPYDKNHLTFHFTAIDWLAPHKIKYQYKIEGLNEKWNLPTEEPKADYRNIPYGTYTFKVRAIGESGKWSSPFEYKFTIHPPWWHTGWFRILYVLCFLLLLFLLYRWRTASLRKRQEELEQIVAERTSEVVQQKEIIEEKHKEITDSINYAERIQRSFLATRDILDTNLKDYFVFFKPKDVVSGDFYWAGKLNDDNFALMVADSTGHGVPGAIMSILNISSLEKSIEKETQPDRILNETRKIIINRLKKDGSPEGGKDGMDGSLLVLNNDKTQLTFASAHNPIIIIRNGEILEFKADKMPVGKHDNDQQSFTLQTIHLQKRDVIYTFTDGFPDQFGGEKGKKYMIKNLKELFLSIAYLPMKEQEQKLYDEFNRWKGYNEQVDDVCIVGVRI